MSHDATQPLLWVPTTSKGALAKMLKHKLDLNHERPSRLDIEAQKAIIISKRCTCLFYEVGATIFHVHGGNFFQISDGYNGASKGDDDPRIVGCARISGGDLHEGKGLCRGSHAELNAIGNAPVDTTMYADVRMMVTLHPCYSCAKQIVNRGIKHIYYIWEYGREDFVTQYLKKCHVEVSKYTSPFLEKWISLNNYDPAGLRYGSGG